MRIYFLSLMLIFLVEDYFPQHYHLKSQFVYAEDLFKSGEYFDAATEFKRLLFFDSSGYFSVKAEIYTGLSYKKGGYYSEAIKHLLSGMIRISDPDSIYQVKAEIVKCNILRRTTSLAREIIGGMEEGISDSSRIKELNLLKGFSYVFDNQWEKASEFFNRGGNGELAAISGMTENELYSVTAAKILSVFIPGAGQIYTGNYLNGLISLGWNALAIYLSVDAFIEERVFDGLVTANFLWFRFYQGNISNASKFAEERNKDITEKTLKILQNYEGYRLY